MSGETEQQVSGWTTDTLHMFVQTQINQLRDEMHAQIIDLRSMLDERYQTQTKAIDAAKVAQETAMTTALAAAEKAVQTASTATEKAVNKAEAATEKRFEGVNEFRAQLADQATTFMSRDTAETRFTALNEKLDTETSRNTQRIRELENRILTIEQQRQTVNASRLESRSQSTITVQVLSALIAAIAIIITVIIAVATHK